MAQHAHYLLEALEALETLETHRNRSREILRKGLECLESLERLKRSEPVDTESSTTENICSECRSSNLVEDQGSLICCSCGMINETILDQGPEWRQFNNDEQHGESTVRCGCPSNYFFPKSLQGTLITGSVRNRLRMRQKWNTMVYRERSLNKVFEMIAQICQENHIPKMIVDSAKFFYKKINDSQIIIRGKNRLSIIAACLYKACEINKNPLSMGEIAQMFGLSRKKITRGNKQFEKIMRELTNEIINYYDDEINMVEDYLHRFFRQISMRRSIRIGPDDLRLTVQIARNSYRLKLVADHNVQSIAAGTMLIMLHYRQRHYDKREMAQIFGVSDTTMGKIFHKLKPYIPALVDDGLTEHLVRKFQI